MNKCMALGLVMVLMGTPAGWGAAETVSSVSAGVTDAGNKMCPVSDEDVTGKHFVEYNGKRYGLCCPMCANKFKRDPEKYLKQMASSSTAKGHDHHHMH